MECLLEYLRMVRFDRENYSDFELYILIIDQVKFKNLQNPIETGLHQMFCYFDNGEMLLHSVVRVFNPEGYQKLAWTSVKGTI